jgi:hypothetical protein
MCGTRVVVADTLPQPLAAQTCGRRRGPPPPVPPARNQPHEMGAQRAQFNDNPGSSCRRTTPDGRQQADGRGLGVPPLRQAVARDTPCVAAQHVAVSPSRCSCAATACGAAGAGSASWRAAGCCLTNVLLPYDFTFDWRYMMRGLIIDKVCPWDGTVQRLTVLHVPLLLCLRLAAPMHRPVPMLRPATVTCVTLPPLQKRGNVWTDTNTCCC